MKKLTLTALAVSLLLGLCACGGNKDNNTTAGTDIPAETITNAQGEVITEIPDEPKTDEHGNTEVTEKTNAQQQSSAQQESSRITAAWGDDGFTHILPEPEFGTQIGKTLSKSGKLLTVSYSDASYEDSSEYLKTVKKAGFDKSVSDMSYGDVIMYFADNADTSFNIGIGYADGKFTVMILKYGD